jgi:pimeloyl-ACP methyl ester carboxylesterase
VNHREKWCTGFRHYRVNGAEESDIQIRLDGERSKLCLVYLPGVHGDWTLLTSFRDFAKERFFLVQITYPRTLRWTMEDYGKAVAGEIERLGIKSAWVLGESFSSQVAWAWLDRVQRGASSFEFLGIILAGGFVRYPFSWVVRVGICFFDIAPWRLWKLLFWIYIRYSSFRHRHAPTSADAVHEFIARRTKLDIAAMRHRFTLIAGYDPRSIATTATCPIYLLAGTIDPIVPTWPVLRWLQENCSHFKGHRIIWPADHNVLGTEPEQSLNQIAAWVSFAPMESRSPSP